MNVFETILNGINDYMFFTGSLHLLVGVGFIAIIILSGIWEVCKIVKKHILKFIHNNKKDDING